MSDKKYDYLRDNEPVVMQVKQHWVAAIPMLVPVIRWLVISAAILLLASYLPPFSIFDTEVNLYPWLPAIAGVCFLVLLKRLYAIRFSIVNFLCNEWLLTNERILEKTGWVARSVRGISLSHAEADEYSEPSWIGKRMGYGTFKFRGAGKPIKGDYIVDALGFHMAVLDQQNKKPAEPREAQRETEQDWRESATLSDEVVCIPKIWSSVFWGLRMSMRAFPLQHTVLKSKGDWVRAGEPIVKFHHENGRGLSFCSPVDGQVYFVGIGAHADSDEQDLTSDSVDNLFHVGIRRTTVTKTLPFQIEVVEYLQPKVVVCMQYFEPCAFLESIKRSFFRDWYRDCGMLDGNHESKETIGHVGRALSELKVMKAEILKIHQCDERLEWNPTEEKNDFNASDVGA